MIDRLIELLQKHATPSVDGASGHKATFSTACFLWGNSSSDSDVTAAMNWYNENMCTPQWNEREIEHKIKDAKKHVGGDVGKYERRKGSDSPATSHPPLPPKPRQPPKPLQNFIEQCRAQYRALPNDANVTAYATGRKLTAETLKRFLCGSNRTGLTLPYFTEDKASVPAVRYRLLTPKPNGTKILSLRGSRFVLPFGLQALTGRPSLVIVEGEINAMSIAQSADVDVLSFGSESIRTDSPQFKIICDVAKRYKHVLIWCDKPEVAQRLGRAIPRADLRQSPNDHDANDLLQRGLLADFLARILPSPTPSAPPKVGDILRTNDGRNITVHDNISRDVIAGLDSGVTDPFYAKPYRLINGVAHEADGVTGPVTIAL